jgi:hypothetical protein
MMAAWEKVMHPSEGHRRLEPMVGTWKAKTTFTMTPGAPPSVEENTSEHRLVLGGRFLEQRYTGTAMGMPFEGIGYTGYDNVQKKYVGTWMDNFGTGVMQRGIGRPRRRRSRRSRRDDREAREVRVQGQGPGQRPPHL